MWILTLLLIFSSQAQSKIIQSGLRQVNVLELFSSEGCSSCPPADKWFSELKKHPKLWKTFIPVEFHVDYWNQLGWTDPFSTKAFSKRQRSLASEWRSSRVYTPGFVLNGKEWKPKNQSFSQIGKKIGQLRAEGLSKTKYKVIFTPQSMQPKNYQVFATLLGNGLITKVPRGENAGRTLQHEFVVLHYKKTLMNKKGDSYVAELDLKSTGKKAPKSMSIAFWVTDGKSLQPLQAVGGDI